MNDDLPTPDTNVPLLEEHRRLMKQLAEFREWAEEVEELGVPHFQEMGNRLQTLRDVLSCHFTDEEAGGYLSPVLDAAPRFSKEAAELQTQHPQFLATLDSLIERLSQNPPPFKSWQEATTEFAGFLDRLRRHEARENAIAQAAFSEDAGGGD